MWTMSLRNMRRRRSLPESTSATTVMRSRSAGARLKGGWLLRWSRKLSPSEADAEDAVVTRDGCEEEMPVVDELVADVSDCASSARVGPAGGAGEANWSAG